jgi:O-antigen ligase
LAGPGALAPHERLARWADQSLPILLTLLLVALTVSITAVGALTGLLILATLLTFAHPAFRTGVRPPLVAPMLGFALVTLASAVAAANPGTALFKSRSLLSLALFFVAARGFRSGAHVHRALRWFFGAIAIVSLYAVVQVWVCATSADLPGWVGWALRVQIETCRVTQPFFRAKGFFSIYMTLGGSLLIALSLLLSALGVGVGRRRAWLLGPVTVALVALALTYSRNAWLGIAAGILVLVVLTRRLVLLLPIALAVLAALILSPGITARLLSIADPQDPTARERLYFWEAGVRMVRAAPLLGFGPGGVRPNYPAFKHAEARKPVTGHLHNNLMQVAVERGLLGLAAWLWIWVGFFARAGRIYRDVPRARADDRALVAGSVAAVAGFLVAGLFEYNFGDAEVINLLWVVMAFPFVVAKAAQPSTPAAPARS